MAAATGRTRGLSQLSGASALGTGTETGPSLSLLAGQGREVTVAGNPCFPDCEEAPPHPAPGLRGFKPLTAQNSPHMLLTPGWCASSARTPVPAAGPKAATAVTGAGGEPYPGEGTGIPELPGPQRDAPCTCQP